LCYNYLKLDRNNQSYCVLACKPSGILSLDTRKDKKTWYSILDLILLVLVKFGNPNLWFFNFGEATFNKY